jgi:hypothetical protein
VGTEEDIMRLMIQAEGVEGIEEDGSMFVEFSERQLMRFAALVAEAEREECAKLCDIEVGELAYGSDDWYIAKSLALIIRARGEVLR